jgi:hypothetical protein
MKTGNGSYILQVENASNGQAALLFVTYASATITEIADPDSIIPGTFEVTKSATSYVVKIENANAGAAAIVDIQVYGATIDTAALST